MSYYNTTKEKDTKEYRAIAKNQKNMIFAWFDGDYECGASDFTRVYPDWPITSIRRALSDLYKEGKIKRSGKQLGIYGRSEYTYKCAV